MKLIVSGNFFWKDSCDNNKSHNLIQSLAQNKRCRPRCEESLGIKKLEILMLVFWQTGLKSFDAT